MMRAHITHAFPTLCVYEIVDSLASLAAGFTPMNDFEREIAAVLVANGLQSNRDIVKGEELELKKLTPEEARERRERLGKMRSLLFKHELKAKRLKNIKSKAYHRHNKKDKDGTLSIHGGDLGDGDEDDFSGQRMVDKDGACVVRWCW